MRMGQKMASCWAAFLVIVFVACSGSVWAADVKIGVVDMKQVLATSLAGKKAENIIKQKFDSLQASLKKDRSDLDAMKQDIDKKMSAWNESVKKEKVGAFQKKGQEFEKKGEEANQELAKLQEQQVGPIVKKLDEIISKVAADGGYAIILFKDATKYAVDSVDISKTVIAELDKVMK